MAKNLFNHLEDLTNNKKLRWEDLNEEDKKSFLPFLVNRFVSMNPYYIDKVNKINQYTYSLNPKDVYNYYLNSLPKRKVFFKYIKKSKKEENKELIEVLQSYFCESSKIVEQYLENLPKDQIIKILQNLSYDEKEIKKLTKNL
jgi:hypothetical protein